jgi:hypothetical protein
MEIVGAVHGATATLLWIIAAVAVIVGRLIGPGGVSIFS